MRHAGLGAWRVTTPIPGGRGGAAVPRQGGADLRPARVSRLVAHLGPATPDLAASEHHAAARGVHRRMLMVTTGAAPGQTISPGGHVSPARDVR